MRFTLNVVRGKGIPNTIEIVASDVHAAQSEAARMGFTVLTTRAKGFRLTNDWFSRRKRSGGLDVLVFSEQLRDLLLAGLSAMEALDALRRGAPDAAALTIEQLERQLQEGKSLSEALAMDPVFPALLIALIRASELTSDLPQTLSRFLEHEQRVAEVRHRLFSTSIYPLLLMGVGSLVLLFLLMYVMPRFARVFEGMTGELPWSARVMLSWAQLLQNYGAWLTPILGLVFFVLVIALLSRTTCARITRRAMQWGLLREWLNTYFLARWYRATGMLVQGGIPLAQSLALANDLLPLAMQDGGRAVEQAVREGLSPSAAHVRAGMVTPVAEQLMLAGERTGDLGSVLNRIAQFHEAEVGRNLERVMKTLEPLVMVLIGVGVGVVVVLMYMPIFELASAIQ